MNKIYVWGCNFFLEKLSEIDNTFDETEQKKVDEKLKSERLAATRSLKSNLVLTSLFILSNLLLMVTILKLI